MGLDAFVPPRIYKPNEMMAREGGNSLLISIIRRQQQQSIAAQHSLKRQKGKNSFRSKNENIYYLNTRL